MKWAVLLAFGVGAFTGAANAQSQSDIYNNIMAGAAVGQPHSSRDSSGSTYTTYSNQDGSSRTFGANGRTGSTWSSATDRDGDESGSNAQGQHWTYSPATGQYINQGSGEMCSGFGDARVCNGPR